MTLTKSVSKNATSLYVTKCVRENGKRTTKVVEKLGTVAELTKILGDCDPIEWAEERVKELTRLEKEGKREILVKFSPAKTITKDEQHSFNGGYLFLQQIYLELGLDKICKEISQRHKFTYDINSILSRLLYARVIFPASKLETYQLSKRFIEQPNFELQHIYRALEVVADEMDYIQSALDRNSLAISKRNTGILYYDCTNYFFEIEQADGLKQYGVSKEHRPNPIVQMGLFMDGDGLPLAFNINDGNTNEQITLQPLEEKILSDFELSKFVVCTDAGLASTDNRKFNDKCGRAFITTQSLKGLKKILMEWALASDGWRLPDDNKKYVLTDLEDDVSEIIKVNHRRWEIEECFRIMKSEFKARPVYLSRDSRINAHFTTCFISLILYRYLEKKLGEKYTCCEIVDGLRDMNFIEIKGCGYIPTYTRTDFTDDLHEAFVFRTDYQIVSSAQMKKIFNASKS